MKRFIIDDQDFSSEKVRLSGPEAHHAANVLRLKADDKVILVDGQGREFTAQVSATRRGAVDLEIIEQRPGLAEPPLHLTLGLGLLKADKMDLVIQKATELGLSALIPINTDRSTIRLSGQRAENRLERWQKISRQALKQCGRSKPVDIAPVTGLTEFLEISRQADLKIMIHPHQNDTNQPAWADLLAATPPVRSVAALVGPEGGFTRREAAEAGRAGFRILPFGPRILRSETAAIALIAVLGFELGDLINFS
jgi:16S rRNA (uracil1498-N3)-methyltransferase